MSSQKTSASDLAKRLPELRDRPLAVPPVRNDGIPAPPPRRLLDGLRLRVKGGG